jgi:hypothetical protein
MSNYKRFVSSSIFFVAINTAFISGGVARAQQPTPHPSVKTNPDLPPGTATSPAITAPLPELVPNASGDGMSIARAKESFSELSLKGSDLVAEPPLLGSREIHPGFIRELWQVRWRPNDPIDLYVILPKGVKNPPVVLYMYGFPTDTDRFKNAAWCDRVVQGGAAAIGFVSALTGQRYNFRPFKENFISELPEALASSVHDVQMVLDYLATRGDLDMNRVGMFGQGSGGAIAILAAATDPRLKAVDLLDPWGDWPDWFATAPDVPHNERADYLKPGFQKALEPLEPLHYLPRLKSPRIRIQFVDDEGEPKDVTARMRAAAPASVSFVEFKTSRRMYDENSGGRLFEWIATVLDAHPAPLVQPASNTASATAAPSKSNP